LRASPSSGRACATWPTSSHAPRTEKALERLSGANGVIDLVRTVDEETVAALPADCRIVARYGVGVDNTAYEAARERRRVVVHSHSPPTVATTAVGGLGRLLRRAAGTTATRVRSGPGSRPDDVTRRRRHPVTDPQMQAPV
jgi:phosphoglycerate dehydrogenase-like enzyme